MMEDKLIITITLERNVNGTINRGISLNGEGFHLYEAIGLLQMCCYELSERSVNLAKELPTDKKVRIKFDKRISDK